MLTFEPVKASQEAFVQQWLTQEHIQKWLHGAGLKNTLADLAQFFKGHSISDHWIAYKDKVPFGYLITSEIKKDFLEDAHLAGKAITLDLFICDKDFLGKGLSVPMIQEFLLTHFADVAEVHIDPEATNARAIHVYKKAGFKIVGEFIASWHPVLHYKMILSMKT